MAALLSVLLTGRCGCAAPQALCCRRRLGAQLRPGCFGQPGGEALPSRRAAWRTASPRPASDEMLILSARIVTSSASSLEVRRPLRAREPRNPRPRRPAAARSPPRREGDLGAASPALPGRPVRARPLPRVEEVFGDLRDWRGSAAGNLALAKALLSLAAGQAHVARSRPLRPPPVAGSAV